MQLLNGVPVSPGFADGTAVVYDYLIEHRLEVPRYAVEPEEIAEEDTRLHHAVEEAGRELEQAKSADRSAAGEPETAGVLAAHQQLVREVAERARRHIRRDLVNVEQAVESVTEEVVDYLQELEKADAREREQDVRDVSRRMLRHLMGRTAWSHAPLPPDAVIVARELLPSEAVDLARSGLRAIVTEQGGTNSHTAILARALGIPAVTGLQDVTAKIRPGMRILVDGTSGEVVAEPAAEQARRFGRRKDEHARTQALAIAGEERPCVTRDGVPISLLANLEVPEEAEQVRARNLDGVGLFRTEFLYLESRERPDFESQVRIYTQVAEALEGRPLVIRTFDLGGDKTPPFLASDPRQRSRAMALRGLRFSLAEQEILETQLRAIVEAARGRDVRVLFPMVVGGDDLGRACDALDAALSEAGATQRPPVGAMIETPAALFSLEEILDLADFVSIGTNDLTQYMLAIDREAADVNGACTSCHPSVLRAIQRIVESAAARGRPVSLCGEDAGSPPFACLLAGLGITELSMTPSRAPQVRYALCDITQHDARQIAQKAVACRTPREVKELLAEFGAGA